MIDYEKELNPEQLPVVLESGGPLLVIAGAGSGKTRTLTYRVARLIEMGIPTERILLATFTNKAARSMLSRVESLIGMGIGGLWGGTFHHCAHRTLRVHAPLLGFDRNFSILDSEVTLSEISSVLVSIRRPRSPMSFPPATPIFCTGSRRLQPSPQVTADARRRSMSWILTTCSATGGRC
jgi:DNA helicase-2/ATP-dependent DNA helicase PcrA